MIRTAALLLLGASIPGTLFSLRAWTQKPESSGGTLRALRLEIVDEKGRSRIALGTNPRNGLFGVWLYSQSGEAVGQLLVEEDGKPSLVMTTPDGNDSCQVVMDDSGTSCLEFFSPTETEGGHWGPATGTAAAIGAAYLPQDGSGTLKYPGFMFVAGKNRKILLPENR